MDLSIFLSESHYIDFSAQSYRIKSLQDIIDNIPCEITDKPDISE